MNNTTDYTLGIGLAFLPLLGYFFYQTQTPLYTLLALGCLAVSTVGYTFYLRKTKSIHMVSLLIMPFILWFVTLKHYFITLASTLSIITGIIALILMAIAMARGMYTYHKLNLQ